MTWLRTLALLLVMATHACSAAAADWPQWLGPNRDGTTAETVAVWKKGDEPKVLWKKAVPAWGAGPQGRSSPVVAGGRVYLHTFGPDENKEEEQVIAFDAADGKELWKDVYRRPSYSRFAPRATPVVAGKRLITLGLNGVLSCYDAEKGKRHWQTDLYKELKERPRTWRPGDSGICSSPLVVGNRVLISIGGKGTCVVAANVETGKIEWQSLDDDASTSSAVVFSGGFRPKGSAADVVFMTPKRVAGLDPLNGALRWEYPLDFPSAGATSPTPAIVGDKLVACVRGSLGPAGFALALTVGKEDDKPAAKSAWRSKGEKRINIISAVADAKAGLLVLVKVEKKKLVAPVYLTGLDAKTGKELWKEEAGDVHASVIRTGDGKLLVLSEGRLSLWEYDAKGARELCSADNVCDPTREVNPALADGRLFCLEQNQLVCLALPK